MSEIISRIEGLAGRITLNRPEALNALTLGMVDEMTALLTAWSADPGVKRVIIDGAGGKALCAGGDIQALYGAMTNGDYKPAEDFFRREYALNRMIAQYQKPVIALMHGIVIGGGVGISAHASHRIVTDRTVFVLPECGIGLIPDVGTTFLLARTPGHFGEYIGLTGARLNAADCIHAKLAGVYVPSAKLPELTQAICTEGPAAILRYTEEAPPSSKLAAHATAISAIFDAGSAVEIAARLAVSKDEWAASALTAIRAGSPLSVNCALWAIRQARANGTLEAALTNEFRFCTRALRHGDFREGVRAAVIDKDRKPVWHDKTLDAVSPDTVAAMFAPLSGGDLQFA